MDELDPAFAGVTILTDGLMQKFGRSRDNVRNLSP
jgi:hypothetical protein